MCAREGGIDILCDSQLIKHLEKQGEKKPDFCYHEVDLSNCSEEYRKAYYDGWNNCNQQHTQLEAEQKSSWNEEDEKMYQSILDDIAQEHNYMVSNLFG